MKTETLVGRRVELDELRGAVEAAIAGRGSLFLVAGEPGIGKSRLVEAVAAHARAQDVTVRWANCWDGPTAPFWPWTQVVRTSGDPSRGVADAVLGPAADLFGRSEYAETEAEPARLALFEAVSDHLRALATRRPMLIVIDDLHWADVPSLRLLEFVARDLRHVRIVIVGNYRDVEAAQDAEVESALQRVAERATLIKLDGLAEGEVVSLLEATTGSVPRSDLARAVFDRTAGNPLFVSELARLLAAQRRLDTPPGALPVPEGIQGVIRRRLARLSQGCHDLLQLASVIGTDFRIDLLCDVRGIPLEEIVAVLDEAETARLVAPSIRGPHRYAFSHALVRDVLYDAIPTSRRASIHRSVAEALQTMTAVDPGPHLAELAHHFMRSLDASCIDEGIEYAARAGRRALDELAYEQAVEHYRRAIEALEFASNDDRRAELLLECGEALLRAGDLPGARDVFTRAADLARRRGDPGALAAAALGFGAGLSGFEVRTADRAQLELLEEALGALPNDDSAIRAWVLARLSVARTMQEPISSRRAAAMDAVEMARRVGDRRALAYALSALCDASAGPADCETRIAWAEEIVELARADGDRPMELLGRRLLVEAFLEVGDVSAASSQCDAFASVAEALRQPLYSWYVPLWHGMRALLAARFDEALRLADEAEATGARAHSANAALLASVLRWMTALQRDRPDEAFDASRVMVDFVGSFGGGYVDVFDAMYLALSGDIERARPLLPRVLEVIRSLPVDSEWLPTACQCSETVARCGDPEAAGEMYAMLLPHRHRVGVEGIGAALHGSMEFHLGLLARTAGRREEAEQHFEAAIEANTRLGAPALVARARRELAHVLAESGSQRAVELASLADQTFRELGITGRDAVSDLGGGRAPVGPQANTFRFEGDFWSLSYDGSSVRVKDAKGLHDVATLLRARGREIAALDLAGAKGGPEVRASGEDLARQGHAGEVLDEQARAAYKARLVELEEQIAEAEAYGDAVVVENASAERDVLAAELAAAYGLGARPRRLGDPAERARTTVTRRIRDAIARIEDAHPALGRHLRNSVRTGTFCAYTPEQPTDWQL